MIIVLLTQHVHLVYLVIHQEFLHHNALVNNNIMMMVHLINVNLVWKDAKHVQEILNVIHV